LPRCASIPLVIIVIVVVVCQVEAAEEIHASWLVTLFHRLSIHESLLIRRWLVLTILTLDYSKYHVLLQHSGSKVITVYFDVHCLLPKMVPTRFRAISVATSIKIGRFLQTPAFASGNPSPAKLPGNLY